MHQVTVRWDRVSITTGHRCKQVIYVQVIYMQCKSLHLLPKFASKTQRIQVGNGPMC